MNFAHIHLILNHIPMLTMPVVLVFFVFAIWTKNKSVEKFSLVLLILTALMVVPVYLTGEPAEKVVKNFIELSEPLVKAHEDSAELSLLFTLMAGVMAFVSILIEKKLKDLRLVNAIVVFTTLLAVSSLGYTANLGGKIRHSELISNENPTK